MLSRRHLLTTTLGSMAVANLPSFARASGPARQVTHVVELFTSQGCSSCPPADAFVAELGQRDDLLTLAYHVDYWDHLGWKDTLGLAENSALQHAYRKAFGNRSVYTPQVVVNGAHDRVGSRADEIIRTINDHPSMPVKVGITANDTAASFNIDIAEHEIKAKALIKLIYVKSETEVPIKSGENRGKTFIYRNAVRYQSTIGVWDGRQASMVMPQYDIAKYGCDRCAVLVQRTDSRGLPQEIIGAADLMLKNTTVANSAR